MLKNLLPLYILSVDTLWHCFVYRWLPVDDDGSGRASCREMMASEEPHIKRWWLLR